MHWEFRQILVSDRAWVRPILLSENRYISDYTFGSIYCWGNLFGYKITNVDGMMLLKAGAQSFSMPMGGGDKAALISRLASECENLTLVSLQKEDAALIEAAFPGRFEFSKEHKWFDYIYSSVRLLSLTGKKLASKRNHINSFERLGRWHTAPISADNIDDVQNFNKEWCEQNGCEKDESLRKEACVVQRGLNEYFELGFEGLVLYMNNEIVGFSYGEPISNDTYCVHVEKARGDVRGSYPMINREFVRAYCCDYKYVNREDDSGSDGLRRAKKSYDPIMMGEKLTARLRNNVKR